MRLYLSTSTDCLKTSAVLMFTDLCCHNCRCCFRIRKHSTAAIDPFHVGDASDYGGIARGRRLRSRCALLLYTEEYHDGDCFAPDWRRVKDCIQLSQVQIYDEYQQQPLAEENAAVHFRRLQPKSKLHVAAAAGAC